MDERVEKRILRQLRLNNIFMGAIAFFMAIMMVVAGFLVWTVVTFVNDTRKSVERIQAQTEETLDIREQICGQGTFRQFINDSFCESAEIQ